MELTYNIDSKKRASMFRHIWSATHRDYRGKCSSSNSLEVMSWAEYGGGIRSADTMSDQELTARFNEIKNRS